MPILLRPKCDTYILSSLSKRKSILKYIQRTYKISSSDLRKRSGLIYKELVLSLKLISNPVVTSNLYLTLSNIKYIYLLIQKFAFDPLPIWGILPCFNTDIVTNLNFLYNYVRIKIIKILFSNQKLNKN